MCLADINIVFMSSVPFPNGAAATRFVRQYLEYFHRHGAGARMLVLRGLPAIEGNEVLEGAYNDVPYRIIGRDLSGTGGWIRGFPRYVRDGSRFLREARHPSRQNVLYHYGQPDLESVWFLRAARWLGYDIVSSIVEDYSLAQEDVRRRVVLKQKIITLMDRRIHSFVDGIVVLSSRLEAKYGGRGVPVALIPVATELHPCRPWTGFGQPVRMLYAGTFGRKDGVEDLLDAFHLLRREVPECELRLVGECSPVSAARLASHGLHGEGVRCTGFLPDGEFERQVDEADVLCMTRIDTPYAHAGFPFKLARYLATGRPVVATDVSDVSRYLADRRDAMIVPPGHATAVAGALRWLLQHPREAAEIGRRGRETCERWFDIEKTGMQCADFIRRLKTTREYKNRAS